MAADVRMSASEPAEAPPPQGERRQLTVVFCDLVGSTRLSQQLDAEEWRDVLARYQDAATRAVERWGGHVAQRLGDGLLIYFGWPHAREDDAQRAVRGGLAIVDAVRELGDTRLSVRIGMHTGTAVITDGGEVFGETINVAARVQTAADPDTVFVTAATQRLVAGMFVLADRGPQALHGVRDRLTLYRVLRPSGVRGRLDIAAGRLTPFVGREVELATLIDRWERAREGEGQTVLVVGEAGVGKSRLVYQLREQLAAVPLTWLECGASPYTQGTPFHPVLGLVSQGLGFAPEDTIEDKLAKLEAGLRPLASEALATLASFLGLPPPTPVEANPEVRRRKTMEFLAQWSLALSAGQPLVVVVEDLHWCDASSLELVGRLIAQSPTARVLVLATMRPPFTPPWPAREHVTTLPLARLTRRQARDMVTKLTGPEVSPATLDALIARSDGVPLFIEELTKSVVEPREACGVEAIPASLADSLMARLDRLSAAKEVAQRAAVLGRDFAYPLLAAVAGLDEEAIREGLARLVEAEIVFARGEPPDSTYTFKHALVQEAAYASLLKRTRQQLHARVASVLEQRFAAWIASTPEVLGRHHEVAGNVGRAVACYQAAGARAAQARANAEAIRHFERALELLATEPETLERDRQELAIRLVLHACFAAVRGYGAPELAPMQERAIELAQRAEDGPTLCPALLGLAMFANVRCELARGYALAERALGVAIRTDDEANAMYARSAMAISKFLSGDAVHALRLCEEVIHLYDPTKHGWLVSIYGEDAGVIARSWASKALWQVGQPERARAVCEDAVRLARDGGHPKPLGSALIASTIVDWVSGDAKAVRVRSAETVAHATEWELAINLGFGRCFAAWTLLDAGAGEEALHMLQEGISVFEVTGTDVGMPFSMGLLAETYGRLGRLQEGLTTVETALAATARRGMHFWDSALQCTKGDLLLAIDRREEQAEACFQKALEIARANHTRSHELRAATRLARLWSSRGRVAEARDLLVPVYAWFTEGHDTRDLLQARTLLDELESLLAVPSL